MTGKQHPVFLPSLDYKNEVLIPEQEVDQTKNQKTKPKYQFQYFILYKGDSSGEGKKIQKSEK